MINLQSFVHRKTLIDLISRWMINQPREGDVRLLKTMVNFNSYISRIWVDDLARSILYRIHDVEPELRIARWKGEIKDFVVDHLTYTSPRIEEMVSKYKRFPEDFYRESPIDGGFYVLKTSMGEQFVGATRIKRFRRIAEKGSRRIVDFMLSQIRKKADQLAEQRAKRLGIRREFLITDPQKMAEEFQHAERRVIKSIKQGTIRDELPVLDIPDVVGLKLIVEPEALDWVFDVLNHLPNSNLVEIEHHEGVYNAVNLQFEYRLPFDLLRKHPPIGRYLEVFKYRGFDPQKVHEIYQNFLDQAEETVLVEVIISNFQEYLESEIGRSMHEERILSQRNNVNYKSHLATNIRYLMTYILNLCRGPSMKEVQDVPIKLWAKYMPDTIDYILRSIYVPEDMFFNILVLPHWQPRL